MSLGSLEIRPFGPADDIEAELDLRRRAFGPIAAAHLPAWIASVQASVDAGLILGVFDGGRLVASARYHVNQQWWHGRSLPMAGVAGVKVAPEERGRGVGTAMMTALLAQIAAQGYPVSVLFPTTAPIYRSVGWEIAGGKYEALLPATALAALVPAAGEAVNADVKLRRATPEDGAAIVEVLGRVHEALRNCGPNTRQPEALTMWLDDKDHFTYLADDGFLSYRWASGHDEIDVDVFVAGSAPTARAFWQVLASHGSVADRVRACVPPDDPVSWLTRDPHARVRCRDMWMLRVVDAPAAVAGRGFPGSVDLAIALELADIHRPSNSGRWTLEVSGGAGRLSPGCGAGPVLRLGSRGFAAMYAGVRLATLRLAGLATDGDPGDDAALDSAFAGPAFMLDYF